VSDSVRHADVEYEPLPMHVSVFLVQRTPSVINRASTVNSKIKKEAQAGAGLGAGLGAGSSAAHSISLTSRAPQYSLGMIYLSAAAMK
jgi:hypothetical protein